MARSNEYTNVWWTFMNFYATYGRRRTSQITVAREVFIGCRVIASEVARQNFIYGGALAITISHV